ncbi:MAG: serine hydrolase domain-containing protein [Actinomycetes bacterium]
MDNGGLLPRSAPTDVGVDPAGLHAFLDGLARRHIQLHSLVLVRHGRVCAAGAWAPHSLSDAPLLYSLSKTFTSAAVGLTVADGALAYDDRLVDLFADIVDAAGPVASRIRVRDCLAMATGHTTDLVPTEGLARASGRLPWRAALAVEPEGEPGVTFQYNQFATWTLAEVVRHATGQTVLELLRARLFAPLGIERASWDTDGRGRVLGYSGLHLAPESVASFFQLLLDDGVRDGRRILPQEWVTRYRQRHVETAPRETNPDWAQGYGWQVWLDRFGGHRGDGAFGQFGVVMPRHDAVLVTTACTLRMQEVLDEVWASLLPAFDRPARTDDAGLAARLDAGRLRMVGGERGGPVHLSFENRANRWCLGDNPEGWRLRWVDSEGGDNGVAVGFGAWRISTMRWGDGRQLRVAASGAWVEWGHWVGHLVVLDAPHALLVRLRDDGSGRVEWVESPPLGVASLHGLALAREGIAPR